MSCVFERLGHCLVSVLECAYPVSRMHVQSRFEIASVQVGEESVGVGEELAIPRVARPAATKRQESAPRSRQDSYYALAILLGHIVHTVPVHVQHGHAQRCALGLEAIHQFEVLLLFVCVVFAPPVTEGPPR